MLTLPPGREASVKAWCLPSLVLLQGTEAAAGITLVCGCDPTKVADAQKRDDACRAAFALLCEAKLSRTQRATRAGRP